jgi:putative peptidoglycan lipid II flippase
MAGDSAEPDLLRRNALLRHRLGTSFARITSVALPTTMGFYFLSREVITLLLQSGTFDRAATERVEPLLAAYGFALLGNAASRVLTTASYAVGDTKTPARYAIYRVVASAGVATGLMQVLDVMGVVLGSVIAAWVEALALGLQMRRRLGGLGLSTVPMTRILALSVGCMAPAVLLRALLPETFVATSVGASCVLGAAGAAFVVLTPKLGLPHSRRILRG